MRSSLMVLLGLTLGVMAQEAKKPAANKDAPVLIMARPLTLTPGFKGKVTLVGIRLNDVTEVSSTTPGLTVKMAGKPRAIGVPQNYLKEKAGDGEIDVEVELKPGTTPASVALIAKGAKGTSEPFMVTVDGTTTITEKEPNDTFAQAQEITVPTLTNGSIHQVRDTDVFRFTGKTGETIRVEVHAAKYGSPADLMLTLYDADRRILASCDDVGGLPDPTLVLTLPRDGTYFLSVIEAHDVGGPNFLYRMSLQRGKEGSKKPASPSAN